MKEKIQKLLNRLGYQIRKYPDDSQRSKIKLFELHNINLVLDVGANQGQYASDLRKMGYKGKIISFEPLSSAFDSLKKNSIGDSAWEIVNIAVGDKDESSSINISSNSFSSSLLEMNSNHITDAAKHVFYTGKESVIVKKIDSILSQYVDLNNDKIFLKLDAQGYEEKILLGASESLKYIKGIQIEMPLLELYKGQTLFLPLLNNLYGMGYELQGLELGFQNPVTMRLYEMDGILFKKPNE